MFLSHFTPVRLSFTELVSEVSVSGPDSWLSPLSYPGTQEQYAVYLRALVRNLFNEGNDVYRERDWKSSISQYTEALNIADYAKSEEILIPKEIIEKLHINRIACYSNMGFHDKVLEDCNTVLSLNASNCKALYRKSKALSDLGRYKEAYDAVAKCSLAVPQDEHVIKLTQELAQKLGFKIRKAYVRAEALNFSVEDIEPDLPTPRQEAVPIISLPAPGFPPEVGSELASVPLTPLTSLLPLQVAESTLPSGVLINGGKVPFTVPEAFLDDGDMVLGDEIDDLLDSAPEANESAMMNGPSSLFAPESFLGISSQPRNDFCHFFGSAVTKPSSSVTPRHPLEGTHDLRQACQICFVKSDVAAEEECRYSGHCTFAYCQEEIDVWTLERKGAFSREAFFGGNGKINLTVFKLLQEHLGEFIFLCECQLDLCRHEVRYGCLREDECFYAHSLVELKVWIMQNETGISHDAIAQESKRYWQNLEAHVPGAQLCNHIASGKKCQYVGNCSFAHSPEEREVWTYMKENGIQDMEQFYELWLKSQKNEKSDDIASQSNKENGKQIHMPTDYAEVTVDFHCWMCGKNCNSEKQWQGHISSEKHKEKVFHTEDDQYCWQHRFPTGNFSICDRYMNGTCTEGSSCKFAHGNAELHEWEERRDALKMKLNKARKDHLIAPNDNDFGKYSFLFKDLN
ncbi:Zinc finger CCCH domain-containing protein 7A [Tupaia chinensis]|uniref:Zinc finger CCCH domain-containing protein 7A n=1 Tax=Tupaia chinensis TaxID=246437 RepID=L9KXW7_TUPCH|nr:Zinc finger CCCH domain-containing protein 7A [Tupaia chinensis]